MVGKFSLITHAPIVLEILLLKNKILANWFKSIRSFKNVGELVVLCCINPFRVI